MHPGTIATCHWGWIRSSPTISACDGLGLAEWGEVFLPQHPRLRRGDALKLLAGDVSAGVVGSYFGRDRGTPILTIEVLKGSDPKSVWDQLRAALLQAIAG